MWELAVRKRTTLSVKPLEDTVTLCILLNQLCVEFLGKVIHLGLTGIVDPSSSKIDYALSFFQRLAPSFATHPVTRFEDHTSVSFARHIVCSRKTSESSSDDNDID